MVQCIFVSNNLISELPVCNRNEATNIQNKGTILALSNGQYYIHNIFYNPENNYEIVAATGSNRSQYRYIYLYIYLLF